MEKVGDLSTPAENDDQGWKVPNWLNAKFCIGVGLVVGGVATILYAFSRVNKGSVVSSQSASASSLAAASAPSSASGRCHFE